MAGNESSLFRKSSLERVSSPDQLNEYIKVTNPSLVVILIAIFSILVAGIIWIFCGTVPKTVNLTGAIAENYDNQIRVYSYVPIGTSRRLKEGMEVQISPEYAEREEFGYITGKITSIGTDVVTDASILSKFKEPQTVYPLVSEVLKNTSQNVIEIEMTLGDWSTESGRSIEIVEGAMCDISAIVGQTKLSSLIFNK